MLTLLPYLVLCQPALAEEDGADDTVVVVDAQREEGRSSAGYEVALGALTEVPRTTASSQLMLAPGVLALNHGGVGHAESFFMRGYDAGEGQDIELLVDGVPMNEVSNPHGHGYADLNLVPPELVREVAVTAGSFEPEQGDFAFAGTAELRLGVDEAGTRLSQGMGSWNTDRTLLIVAPAQAPDTLGAFEFTRTKGFGENRAAQRALALGRLPVGEGQTLSVYGYAVRFDQAGAVRADDIAEGTVDRLGTYDPNQGGEGQRLLVSHRLVRDLPGGAHLEHTAFAEVRASRMRNNWTGWMNDPGTTSTDGTGYTPSQRGDGLELDYQVFRAGARGRYDWQVPLLGRGQTLSVGHTLRLDHGRTEQLRLRDTTAIPYAAVFDDRFTTANLAGWGGARLRLSDRLLLQGGGRLDSFAFAVRDDNLSTSDRDGDRLPYQTSQAMGFALNPRATVDYTPVRRLHLLASYGQATRSTEAMALSDNETAPFALARQADAGMAWQLGNPGGALLLTLQGGVALSRIDKDLLFSESEGRNVLVGASTRRVATLSTRAQVLGWLDTLVNVGWARATLDDTGALLPYVPDWVLRVDSAATGRPGLLAGSPVQARLGGGLTWVPPRPLPYGERADTFLKLDGAATLERWPLALSLEVRNLLDRENSATELVYASQFEGPDAPPDRLPAHHLIADEPRTAMLTLTLWLEKPSQETP
ncbi:MAG: TonB-dependent receptor [Deltaproteobacteria bacterium]|nr:TonB-dependent receptor [Deltaproteobacteria bacterium]